MKKHGRKKLQGKKRKNPEIRKFMDRENSLRDIRRILKVLALYEEILGFNMKYSLAQALLDRMTPEVPSAEAFARWVLRRILAGVRSRVPVSELPQFSADTY